MPRPVSPRRAAMQAKQAAPLELPRIPPNAATKAKYQHRMEVLIAALIISGQYWLLARYKRELAETADIGMAILAIEQTANSLARRWQRKFDEQAFGIAGKFSNSLIDRVEAKLRQQLAEAGIPAQFAATPEAAYAREGMIVENAGLVRSIPGKYLGQLVKVMVDGTVKQMPIEEVEALITAPADAVHKRAEAIADHQTRKHTEAIAALRKRELGLNDSVWHHLYIGSVPYGHPPRHSHVMAEGRPYKSNGGCEIDGNFIQPGELPYCHCYSTTILPPRRLI